MQKEECRRLVWSTIMLTVAGSSYGAAGTDEDPEYLWIKDPANVSVSDLPSRPICVFRQADRAGLDVFLMNV